MTNIYWIDENKLIGIMPKPRGNDWLDDEIRSFKEMHIKCIVSLLEHSEVIELELEKENYFCNKYNIDFLNYPIKDRSIPATHKEFDELIQKLMVYQSKKEKIAIHCRMGIGRASLIAIAIMINLNFTVEQSLEIITQARGLKVPDTSAQIEWLERYANIKKNENFL